VGTARLAGDRHDRGHDLARLAQDNALVEVGHASDGGGEAAIRYPEDAVVEPAQHAKVLAAHEPLDELLESRRVDIERARHDCVALHVHRNSAGFDLGQGLADRVAREAGLDTRLFERSQVEGTTITGETALVQLRGAAKHSGGLVTRDFIRRHVHSVCPLSENFDSLAGTNSQS
jgi:hypothetical protein